MKAVIVFDVDSDFDFDQKLWVQIEEYLDGEILESGCHAVRPMPSRKNNDESVMIGSLQMDIGYILGWNDCLEEIEKCQNCK